MHILAVDDDPDILELLAASLRALGYDEVSTAQSAREALAVCETVLKPVDVFLVDIQMPEITGIELCQDLRDMQQYRDTPIVILTAMSDGSYIDRAFAAGATDYLVKPFSIDDLKHRISLATQAASKDHQIAQLVQKPATVNLGEQHPSKTIRFSDALPIDDVAHVVRVHTFESYLSQQGLLEFHLKTMVIVQVGNAQQIFDRCDTEEFLDQMSDIAEAISNALSGVMSLITYCGSGVFLMMVDSRAFGSVDEFSLTLEDCAAQLAPCYRNGDPVMLDFSVTEVRKPRLFLRQSKGGYIQRLLDQLRTGSQGPGSRSLGDSVY